jgi:ligand-binding SRPBCC domain-containing protein
MIFEISLLIGHDHKMKTYHLKWRQRLSTDREKAWRFFSNPSNLSLITPPWLDFRITSKTPAEIYAGLIITYTIRPFAGVAVPWVSEITQVKQPHFFVDEQRHGPFSFWHHQHHLKPVHGGIDKIDEIHYRLPGGIIGILTHTLSVHRKLKEIFDYRQKVLNQVFGAHQ